MRDPFLVVVVAAAALLRLWGIDHGLPFVYNPDEANIMARSLSIATGLDPEYYLYPSFYFYMMFAVMGGLFVLGWVHGAYENVGAFQARFFEDPTAFYVAGRLVVVAAALATIVFTYALVRKHFSRSAARAASLFIAVAYFHVRDAHYLKHDVVSGLLMVIALWAIDRAVTTRAPRAYWAAGAALGLAFATHYYTIFLAPAFIVYHWACRGWKRFSDVVAAGAVSAVTFFVLSPFVVLRLPTALEHMRANRQVVVDRSLDEGLAIFPSLPRYAEFLVTQGLGFVLFTLVLAGFVVMARADRKRLALWGGFPLLFFGFITYTFFAGRYLNPILPSLAAAAGVAVAAIEARAGKAAAVAVAALATLQPLYWSAHVDRLFAGEDTRTLARAWILDHVASGTTLALQSYSVPLPQSADSFRESLAANDALDELERRGKYASLLDVAEAEPVGYPLYFLGAGDELNRIYIGYDELARGLDPLVERGVSGLVLRRAPVAPPEAVAAVFERAAEEGTLLTRISPFANGIDATPYLDNEDWAPSARLSHKGPLVEIWSLEKISR
jgi:4-amino-4-deoxy-L-arabinose transferase-like glycosyltransferase